MLRHLSSIPIIFAQNFEYNQTFLFDINWINEFLQCMVTIKTKVKQQELSVFQ